MAQLPCPKCGSEDTVGTFCKSCLRELHPLVKDMKEVKLVLCHSCDRVRGKAWQPLALEDAIKKAVDNAVKPSMDAKISEIVVETPDIIKKPGINRSIDVDILVRGKQEEAPEEYEEEYVLPLSYEVTVCTHCKKASPTYYEGILQIRNETPEAKEKLKKLLSEKRSVHLTNSSKVESGTDYYLSDHRVVAQLVKHLQKKFGGELKVNAQHFSENKQSGKILYRTTAFLALPDYSKGDIVKKGDGYFLITGISTKIIARELLTGEKGSFQYHRDEAERLEPVDVQVSGAGEVLHPETFQPTTVENSADLSGAKPGDTVKVVIDGNHLFCLRKSL
ncbi:hypothetical protein GOV11_00225 [Candidatus Woesearchaeota archaeon]|nr:hypothetical protein [Candidatus Woesearchaeota archaeon]